MLTWLGLGRGGSRVSTAPPVGPVGPVGWVDTSGPSGPAGLGVSGSGEVAGAGRGLGAGVIRSGSWLVDRINETEEVLDLLRGGGGGPVVRALAEHPELLVLMLALPDIAGQLNAQPELVEGYLFRDFLVGEFWPEHGGSEDFVVALDTYLGERGIVLAQGWRPQVRDAALVTWSRVVAEQETVRARAESERRARLSGLQPNDRATWRWSGRIHYGEGVSVDPSSDLPQVLERVAEGLSVRETNFALHQGLHAHLDGGSGGVSFAYVLADDGQVDVLAYAVSSARSGNAYKWPGNGGSYTGGPLDIRAVAQHPRYQASLGLVRDRALAGAEQPAAAVPSGERPSQLADPHADLRAAILTYHQAHTALATQAAAGAEPAPAPTVGRGKKKKKKSAGSAADRLIRTGHRRTGHRRTGHRRTSHRGTGHRRAGRAAQSDQRTGTTGRTDAGPTAGRACRW